MRKVIERTLYSMLVIMCCFACNQRLKPIDYVRYVNDMQNGCKKITRIDGWEYCFQYKPYDYIMLMENKGDRKGYDFEKRKAELQGTAWFNISVKRIDNSVSPLRYGISSLEEYNSRLDYFINHASEDIRLSYDDKILQPTSYLFENGYNLTPQETMVVGFTLPDKNVHGETDMKISVVDRVFNNGIINATFSSKKINNLPGVNY